MVLAEPASAASSQAASPAVDEYTVVTGIVTVDGRPAAGATVTLIAWPNQDVLDGLGDGDAVDTKIVSQATTDARGRFAASLNPTVVGSDHTGADGEVDIQLAASHSDKEIVWSFTATRAEEVNLEASAWASSLAEDPVTGVQLANQGFGPTHLAIDIGDPGTVVQKGNEPWTWIGPDGEPLGVGAEATAAAQVDSHYASIGVAAAALSTAPGLSTAAAELTATGPHASQVPAGCSPWVARDEYHNGVSERFVRALGLTYAPVTVTQTVSASHELGIAVKGSGKNAKWSQSGKRKIATSAKSETNYGAVSAAILNRVNYRLHERVCYAGSSSQIFQKWRPHSFHSLNTDKVLVSRPNWNKTANCQNYSAGTHFKERGRNATFSTGVELPVIGVSANAEFNTSNAIQLKWTFSRSGGRLCGSTNKGWASSATPEAGAFVRP